MMLMLLTIYCEDGGDDIGDGAYAGDDDYTGDAEYYDDVGVAVENEGQ